MKKLFLTLFLTGCGAVDRTIVTWTGQGVETCQGGVVYLQFTSGASVAYNRDGSIRTCER